MLLGRCALHSFSLFHWFLQLRGLCTTWEPSFWSPVLRPEIVKPVENPILDKALGFVSRQGTPLVNTVETSRRRITT